MLTLIYPCSPRKKKQRFTAEDAEVSRRTRWRSNPLRPLRILGVLCVKAFYFFARQADGKLGELAQLAVYRDRAAMLLRHDVVADRQAEPGALAGRLGGEERLEQFAPDLRIHAGAVVAHRDLDRIAQLARRHLEGRLEAHIVRRRTALVGGIEAVAEQVEENASHILRHQFYRRDGRREIALQRDVEILVLG